MEIATNSAESAPSSKHSKKTPRTKHENLYQRGGVWWIRFNAGGRKIRRSLETKSLREAKRLRDEILGKRTAAAKFGIEPPIPRKERTFSEVVKLWLEARKADNALASGTISNCEYKAKIWLLPEFGSMPMGDITVEHVERFLGRLRSAKSKRTGRTLSQTTIAEIFRTLNMIYRQALKRGWYTGPNSLDLVERRPRTGPGRDVTLTEDEAKALLAHLSGKMYYKAAIALATGLRWGELHGLAWADIELGADPPTLTVRRSYRGKPKNEASAATIPLSEDAAALLRQWQAEQGGRDYVFPGKDGQCVKRCGGSDARPIKTAARKAGISKRVHPHVFRHTFGTWVYERTGDPKTVQRLMRHAAFTTSMKYVHDRRELGAVVNKLPRLAAPRLKAA